MQAHYEVRNLHGICSQSRVVQLLFRGCADKTFAWDFVCSLKTVGLVLP